MLFDDAPDPDEVHGTDDPRISLVRLLDEHPEIGRGLDIARQYGIADLDENDEWVVGDLSRLELTYSIPSSETSFEETFSWWRDNRGQHQISGLLLAPLVALMLIFFGAGLQRSLGRGGNSGHGSVAFGGAILGAAGFALIGELEGAAANAAHEGHQEAVYALSQLQASHQYQRHRAKRDSRGDYTSNSRPSGAPS